MVFEVTPDTYFTSKETVYSFLVRSFTHWRWFHGFDRATLQECTTDEMCVTQKGIHYNDVRYSQLQHHDWTPLHPNNEETWRGVGMGVAMALACKEDLSGVDYVSLGMTEELKADHQMQLQTLVAYFYLRGLDFYGGMPIYRRSTTEEVPRSTARETFNYVEELLLAAIPKLEKKEQICWKKAIYVKELPPPFLLSYILMRKSTWERTVLLNVRRSARIY